MTLNAKINLRWSVHSLAVVWLHRLSRALLNRMIVNWLARSARLAVYWLTRLTVVSLDRLNIIWLSLLAIVGLGRLNVALLDRLTVIWLYNWGLVYRLPSDWRLVYRLSGSYGLHLRNILTRLLILLVLIPLISNLSYLRFHITNSIPHLFRKSLIPIFPLPIIIKFISFFFINIIIMISFLIIIPYFLLHYFSASIIKHSLFCNSINPCCIFICLLFLWYGVSLTMLSHVVLKIILSDNLSIWAYFWGTYETLHHEWTLVTITMHVFMD